MATVHIESNKGDISSIVLILDGVLIQHHFLQIMLVEVPPLIHQ